MLKKILDSIDGLHEELAKLYTKKDDGKFHLQLENDDAEPLRRAKEHEVGLRQLAERDLATARQELEAAKARITTLEGQASKDVQAVRADHERAIAELQEKHRKATENLETTIRKIFVNDVASKIANEIAIDEGAAELLAENLSRRLSVEMVNGNPVTRVVGADGTPTVASPDDLKREYLQNAKYAGILRASEASGGGATGGNNRGGAPKKLSEMSESDRVKMAKENPAEFQRLVEQARSEAE